MGVHLNENEDGTFSFEEEYQVSNMLTVKFFGKSEYEMDIAKCNDIDAHANEILEVYTVGFDKQLNVTDMNIDKDEDPQKYEMLENTCSMAVETIKFIHSATIDCFGNEIFDGK